MTTGTHKLLIWGVIAIASEFIFGSFLLSYFGKTVTVEVVAVVNLAIGGMLGHLTSPDKKIEDPKRNVLPKKGKEK